MLGAPLVANNNDVATALGAQPSVSVSSVSPSPSPSPIPVSADVTSESGTGGENSDPAVFHAGPATLPPGTYFDLDAPSSDPQWGMLMSGQGGGNDVQYNANFCPGLCTITTDAKWVEAASDATYSTCQTTTGYAQGGPLRWK